MKRSELVHMVDGREFIRLLSLAKVSPEVKTDIIRERSAWLWETFKPSDEELEYIKKATHRKEVW